MQDQENIIICENDFQKISSLVRNAQGPVANLLQQELDRAVIVSDEEVLENVVTMNSKVTFQDLNSGKQSMLMLVYPADADIQNNKVSILAPVGSALIGLRVGQVIKWPVPSGKEKTFKVISVSN